MLNLHRPPNGPESLAALEAFGWNSTLAESFRAFDDKSLRPARVAVEDKHRYIVLTPEGELAAHLSGKFLHEARSAADFPKVGDWLVVSPTPNEPKAVIQAILPRRTKLSRKAAGRLTDEQVLAANVDIAFVVQALDESFNPRLLQRHLVMVLEGDIRPVIVLNKVDLCPALPQKLEEIQRVAGAAAILPMSAWTGEGIEQLRQQLPPGVTAVFIGSSGVGKSSLINQLCGQEIQATTEVREGDAKGRHTTTCRELILVPQAGMVIDTPGMREFALWSAESGLEEAFPEMEALAERCRFRDCTHTVEKHCAVLAALSGGQLRPEQYGAYLKLKRELVHLEAAQNRRSYLEKKRQTKTAQRAFNRLKRRRDATVID